MGAGAGRRARARLARLSEGLRPRTARAPLYQYGYGAYGSSLDPGFDLATVSLLDRGFVYALAHVRGGQEMGRAWYEDGKLLRKKNTFTDFVDVTDYLVREKYAAPDTVFATGGSAGGLLMGAVANIAPEKYRAIVANVPFVDVVTTMLDLTIPLTSNEFDEWGDPKEKAFYDYLLSYSPYDNVGTHPYPAMLVTTGLLRLPGPVLRAGEVGRELRTARPGPRPLLFRINMAAGHAGKSGRFEGRGRWRRSSPSSSTGSDGATDPKHLPARRGIAPAASPAPVST